MCGGLGCMERKPRMLRFEGLPREIREAKRGEFSGPILGSSLTNLESPPANPTPQIAASRRISRARKAPDLLALAALVWALAFGLVYAERILRARAPRLAAAIHRVVGGCVLQSVGDIAILSCNMPCLAVLDGQPNPIETTPRSRGVEALV